MGLHRIAVVTAAFSALVAGSAEAHFALDTPPPFSVQDSLGLPEKSAPCGQADPANPLVLSNMVTTYHAGDTITIMITEEIFHPGHYRVALADTMDDLPADPVVTAGATACGTAAIQSSATTPGVIVDDQLDHTAAFTAPQSFQVTLPSTPCANCTLQVIEFMSDHGLNNPGGCFYHHCATVNIVSPDTPLPDAGVPGGGTIDAGVATGTGHKSGGCAVGGGDLALGLCSLGVLGIIGRYRAKRGTPAKAPGQ